jgi:hypothetical protein
MSKLRTWKAANLIVPAIICTVLRATHSSALMSGVHQFRAVSQIRRWATHLSPAANNDMETLLAIKELNYKGIEADIGVVDESLTMEEFSSRLRGTVKSVRGQGKSAFFLKVILPV